MAYPHLDETTMRDVVSKVQELIQSQQMTTQGACIKAHVPVSKYYKYQTRLRKIANGQSPKRATGTGKTRVTGIRCRVDGCEERTSDWFAMKLHLDHHHHIQPPSITQAIANKQVAYITEKTPTAPAPKPTALAKRERAAVRHRGASTPPVPPTPANYTVQEITIPVPVTIRIAIGGIQIGAAMQQPPEPDDEGRKR